MDKFEGMLGQALDDMVDEEMEIRERERQSYNQALEDVLNVVEWDGYTLDIKERIEQLKK